ncbi:hypothetical protein BDP27DRAFT_1372286 [Rhodocollybia butyracea]|uniref:Uncharacterized protein n=1 Tax=Rhodocollybia butyracea TaxID=206335 RepID=A0A9P5TXE9_9AGAR|nr:hypothetical protein BDP27DRAFT_1372286 [Rhodocollybia butyracea]
MPEFMRLLKYSSPACRQDCDYPRNCRPKINEPGFLFPESSRTGTGGPSERGAREDDLGPDFIGYTALEMPSPCPVDASRQTLFSHSGGCSQPSNPLNPPSPPVLLGTLPNLPQSHKQKVRAAKRRFFKALNRTSSQQNALRQVLSHGTAVETFQASRGAHTSNSVQRSSLGRLKNGISISSQTFSLKALSVSNGTEGHLHPLLIAWVVSWPFLLVNQKTQLNAYDLMETRGQAYGVGSSASEMWPLFRLQLRHNDGYGLADSCDYESRDQEIAYSGASYQSRACIPAMGSSRMRIIRACQWRTNFAGSIFPTPSFTPMTAVTPSLNSQPVQFSAGSKWVSHRGQVCGGGSGRVRGDDDRKGYRD